MRLLVSKRIRYGELCAAPYRRGQPGVVTVDRCVPHPQPPRIDRLQDGITDFKKLEPSLLRQVGDLVPTIVIGPRILPVGGSQIGAHRWLARADVDCETGAPEISPKSTIQNSA